ncbi:multiheme c-type cytochrome [Deinococcus altitudinis]|uniref:multiheme c-type cytochrome n=1 Tax=Deinococcus altitudinis TaxID=468914 RepID=UPI0038922833
MKIGSGGQVASNPYSASSPFAPSEANSSQRIVFHAGAYPSAGTCGRCHVAIHDNWQSSLHRLSASDAWYLKTKDLLAFEEGAPAVRLCAGCHAPVSLMTGEVGLYSSEAASIREGITCSFCHTLSAVNGGNAKYVSNPGGIRPYPQGDYLAESGIQPAAHLVMLDPAQHRADMLKPFYRTSQFCQSCHELTLNNVKLQSTFSEWAASSYAQKGVTCQGCHFTPGAGPTTEVGRLVEHYPDTRSGILRHSLGGGSVTIGTRDNRSELKDALKLSARVERGRLLVTVRNVLAGHSVPTGVSDLRELWVEVTGQDVNGRKVFHSGHLDAAEGIQPGSTVFHMVLGDESGRPLVRHDIWRARSVLSDTRIPADGQRVVTYPLPTTVRHLHVRLLWRDAPSEFQAIVVQGATRPAAVLTLADWQHESP